MSEKYYMMELDDYSLSSMCSGSCCFLTALIILKSISTD